MTLQSFYLGLCSQPFEPIINMVSFTNRMALVRDLAVLSCNTYLGQIKRYNPLCLS